ncbi:MAG: GNAT family N-acetyltransferase [Nocardiopsaceae bacterium]|jgi:GNAT superfamily N-acetyltransferase|nr:GNAT family N-acetyltransferase [Nocardiopsaceae bacterium]
MNVNVRPARPGDGDGMARAWLSAAEYHTGLDPEHFRVPAEAQPGEFEEWLGRSRDGALLLAAELDGRVVGWLSARIEPPHPAAASQLVRELGWTRLAIDALVVDRADWRHGAGTALLTAAEAWGREQGAEVVRLDTYSGNPVSVPFYEDRMGYQRRAIVFQKRLT